MKFRIGFAPDCNGILFLAFSARKRYSEKLETGTKKPAKLLLQVILS